MRRWSTRAIVAAVATGIVTVAAPTFIDAGSTAAADPTSAETEIVRRTGTIDERRRCIHWHVDHGTYVEVVTICSPIVTV